jgi:hypothetical protein
MRESLASFRELKGIGPATEARLHAAGVYTWEALSEVVETLGKLGACTGDHFRELAGQIAERRPTAGAASPRRGDAERSEAFVVRIALARDGQPVRSTVTHVQTQTEQPLAGWSPAAVIRLIESQAALSRPPRPAEETEAASSDSAPDPASVPPDPAPPDAALDPAPAPAPAAYPAPPPVPSEHLIVLDAGRAIGGSRRTVELVVQTNRMGDPASFEYRATLAGRPYGEAGDATPWTVLGSDAGRGRPPARLPVRFEAVELPPGLQRLRLELALRLARPRAEAPPLALA